MACCYLSVLPQARDVGDSLMDGKGRKGTMHTNNPVQWTAEQKQEIENIRARYPKEQNQAALLPILHLAQDSFGCLSPGVIEAVSRELQVPRAAIEEVVSFYTMFTTTPRGTYHIQVCHNLSCTLMGAESLLAHLQKKLGISAGETTADGRFTLSRVECLAACDGAPMLQLNDAFHTNLTAESLDSLLDGLA